MSPNPTSSESASRPDWTRTVSAITSILSVIITTVGLLGLWLQIQTYNNIGQQESERRLRDAYGKLYPMDAEVWKFIGQYPKLKVAFLDDKNGDIVNKMSEDGRGRFDAACQMMAGMFEYYPFD